MVSNGAGYDTWDTKRTLSKTMVSRFAAQMVGAVEGAIRIYGSPVTPETPWPRNYRHSTRIMPAQKKYFNNKLTAWNRRRENRKGHEGVQRLAQERLYAATETGGHHLLSEKGSRQHA